MRTTLIINLFVALSTFSACLLAPWYLEHGALKSIAQRSSSTEYRSPLSPHLEMEAVGAQLDGTFVPRASDRIEAARRVRAWVHRLDICQGVRHDSILPKWCQGVGATTTAAQVARMLLGSSSFGRSPHQRRKLLVQTSAWMGGPVVEALRNSLAEVDSHLIAIGSPESCLHFVRFYEHRLSMASPPRCLDIEHTNREQHSTTFLGEGTSPRAIVFRNCSQRDTCTVALRSDDQPTLAEPSGREMQLLDSVVPDLIVLDLDAGMAPLAIAALASAMSWIAQPLHKSSPNLDERRGTAIMLLWQSQGANGAASLRGELRHELTSMFVVRVLDGDCVAAVGSGLVSLDDLLDKFVAAQAPGAPDAFPITCIFVVRLAARERLFPLDDALSNPLHSARRSTAREPSAMLPAHSNSSLGPVDVLLMSTAVLVGVALCYGISKNWVRRKHRRGTANIVVV